MAAKKHNWGTIAGLVVAVAVVWLIWPRKAHAATSSGRGVGSAAGGFPFGFGGAPGAGAGPSAGGGGGSSLQLPHFNFGRSPLKRWIDSVLKQGYANAAQLQVDNGYLPGLGELPGLSIPSQPMQLFDVSQLAQNIPADLSSFGIDPSYGADQLQLSDTNFAPDSIGGSDLFPVGSLATSPADLSSYGIDPNYGASDLSVMQPDFSTLQIAAPDLGGPYGSADSGSGFTYGYS